jgi:hypothetical protein
LSKSAPDGRLIPVPDQYPPGILIRDDAQITVSASGSGFYVAIFNGPPESAGELSHLIGEVLTEAAITRLEHILAESAATGAKGLIKFGGLFVILYRSSPSKKGQTANSSWSFSTTRGEHPWASSSRPPSITTEITNSISRLL